MSEKISASSFWTVPVIYTQFLVMLPIEQVIIAFFLVLTFWWSLAYISLNINVKSLQDPCLTRTTIFQFPISLAQNIKKERTEMRYHEKHCPWTRMNKYRRVKERKNGASQNRTEEQRASISRVEICAFHF